MNFGPITTTSLGGGLWTFNEPVNGRPQTDAYLITGNKRALVIDALTEDTELFSKVREITDLPLQVIVTHGHPDHAGAVLKDFHEAGCEIFMHEADFDMLKPGVSASWFTPLTSGMKFDLGGRVIEAVPLAGHTVGSMVLLDRAGQLAFTGDAVGAGVFWMQIPGALPLREFLVNLKEFCGEVAGFDDLTIHTGHRHQLAVQHKRDFLDEVVLMTEKIISGEWAGEDREMSFGGDNIKYKSLSHVLMSDYCYNPNNI